ncbi:MAG: imidazolonepropionase [Hyphomicrobiales bacterium]
MTAETGDYGLLSSGAVAMSDGDIAWVGADNAIPDTFLGWQQTDLKQRLVTPALIDCHTHIVHGGNRAREFEMRLEGASYEEVARAGGGIVSTVKSTRETSEEDLLESALKRLDVLIAEGVSTIEVKSGYGLNRDAELKMLRVARQLALERPINVKTSFLGAHAVPAEFLGHADNYIDDVCIPTLNEAHEAGLVDAVDGFCEGIAFSPAQIERVFKRAQDLGIPIKLHAEQLSDLGGAKLAARYSALSADHLEYLSEEGVLAMSKANTVAVVLPGAFYTLRETQIPPIALFRKHNVPMAIASDSNPGSSPLTSLLLTMNMSCTLFRMTPEEALAGVTRNAAKALGLINAGTIAVGQRADLAIWDVQHPSELSYRIGYNPLYKRIFGGLL